MAKYAHIDTDFVNCEIWTSGPYAFIRVSSQYRDYFPNFVASNGVSIRSVARPELKARTVYLRGDSEFQDDIIVSYLGGDTDCFLDDWVTALKEFCGKEKKAKSSGNTRMEE